MPSLSFEISTQCPDELGEAPWPHTTTDDGEEPRVSRRAVPVFINVDEAAEPLRTTRRAIYAAMVERRQLPDVVRLRRRVLFRSDVLLDWLDQKCAPSPKE